MVIPNIRQLFAKKEKHNLWSSVEYSLDSNKQWYVDKYGKAQIADKTTKLSVIFTNKHKWSYITHKVSYMDALNILKVMK